LKIFIANSEKYAENKYAKTTCDYIFIDKTSDFSGNVPGKNLI